MINQNDILQLLANPYHMKNKKNDIVNYIDNEIFTILHKKFPGYIINENDKPIILEKFENIFYEISIVNIVSEVINNILTIIELDYE